MIGAREDEQVLREPNEAIGLVGGGLERLLELVSAAWVPERELQLRLQQRERGAQLVTRVGDEAPFALERGVEPAEHGVQGLSEAADLVARRRQRQAPARLGAGDPLGFRAHRLDRAKSSRGQGVAEERGEHERHEPDHDELRQEAVQGFVPVIEGGADDDHRPCAVRRRDRAEEHANGAGEPGWILALDRQRVGGERAFDRLAVDDGRIGDVGGRVEEAPVGCERLSKALVDGHEEILERLSAAESRLDLQRPLLERLGDRVVQRLLEPQVEKRAGRGEHQRQRQREDEREPQADGQPAHTRR